MSLILTGYSRAAAASSFTDPTDLTNLLAWYDASDLTTLYQTNTTATPVTTGGQDVGRWEDKSGNANHLTATSALPSYETASGRHWVYGSGTEGALSVASRFGLGANPELNVILGIEVVSQTQAVQFVFALGATSTGHLSATVGTAGWAWRHGDGTEIYDSVTTATRYRARWHHPSGGDYASDKFFRNGVEQTPTTAGDATVPTSTAAKFDVFANGTSNRSNARIYQLIVCGAMTSQEISDLDNWIAGKIA